MNEAYEAGWQAYYEDSYSKDNPHYLAFDDLPQEYYDWNRGWDEAEDAYYRKIDDDESTEWQEYLRENEGDNT